MKVTTLVKKWTSNRSFRR